MSGLLRRVPSLALVAFVVFLGIDAQAGYLFRLTEQEIVDTMDYYYPKGYDRELVLRQMSEPFDCKNFEDLCEAVGDGYAYSLVENTWARATKRYPIEMIGRTVEQQLEDFSRRWFDQLYPDGVAERDSYWGATAAAGPPECDPTVSATSGDFRVRHTSRRFTVVALAFARVKVEHFKKNLFGNFKPERADLEVEGLVFVEYAGFPPAPLNIGDSKDDAKSVAATHVDGGWAFIIFPYVEGCGGVQNNFALRACSCLGTRPFGF